MTWCLRWCSGALWRFWWFRWLVVAWCLGEYPGAGWVARNTPLIVGLRQWLVDCGELAEARPLSDFLRLRGEI
jgi:hypothetical protein